MVRKQQQECEEKVQDLRAKRAQLEEKERAAQAAVDACEAASLTADKASAAFEELLSRWRALKQRAEDLSSKRRRQSQMSGLAVGDGRSIADVEEAQSRRAAKKDELVALRDKLYTEETGLQRSLHALQNSLTEKERAKVPPI